jgi:hypothetical protein
MWKSLKGRLAKVLRGLLDESDKPEIPRIPRFIDADSILQRTNNIWHIGKRKLSQEEVSALKGEAEEFQDSYLWRVMRKDVHYLAYLQATAKRRTDDDAIYAAAMYRDLEILEQFIENCLTKL